MVFIYISLRENEFKSMMQFNLQMQFRKRVIRNNNNCECFSCTNPYTRKTVVAIWNICISAEIFLPFRISHPLLNSFIVVVSI